MKEKNIKLDNSRLEDAIFYAKSEYAEFPSQLAILMLSLSPLISEVSVEDVDNDVESIFETERELDGKIAPLPLRKAIDNQKMYLDKYCS